MDGGSAPPQRTVACGHLVWRTASRGFDMPELAFMTLEAMVTLTPTMC